MPVYTVAQYAVLPLAAAMCLCVAVMLMPRRPGQRVPWGPMAVVAWLSALAQLVLSTRESGVDVGLRALAAAIDTACGVLWYRLWQRDDDDRPRRRRRVLRLAFGGGRA